MNYKEAFQIQNEYQYLIGQKDKYNQQPISNILALPCGYERVALERILTNTGLSPSRIIQSYNAKEYTVVVLIEIQGNYVFQDISMYLDSY